MSSSVSASAKSASYHHGDLRQALIQAARAALKEKGVDKLSLREVARNTGVSHAAAYHHFRDKTGLIAAVAVAAFGELETALRAAPKTNDALTHFKTLLRVYITFALKNPDEFRLMFLPQLRSDEVRTEVEAAGRVTYTLIVAALAALQDEGRLKGDPERAAITAWATAHGLATLMLDGPLYRNAASQAGSEALLTSSTEHLLSGLVREH
ncbi:TetR/AcrR family transcriptional regulator [soil metagenome]